jgi:hypothetical protein
VACPPTSPESRSGRRAFRQINDFERYLTENNIHVLKFYLHISRDEQRRDCWSAGAAGQALDVLAQRLWRSVPTGVRT